MEQKYEISTNKLKIKTRNLVEHEVDVELPYFAKYGTGAFFKVISDSCSIAVSVFNCNTGIEISHYTPYVHPEAEPCTEEEFNTAYEFALSKIQNL